MWKSLARVEQSLRVERVFARLVHANYPQFDEWQSMAQDAVAILRQEAGRDPRNRDLTDLIGELSTRSEGNRL